MPLYSNLAALSQTAGANAADGAVDAPATIDNNMNLLASFIAQLRDNVGFTAPLATTGDFKLVMRAAAPAGWVAANGGTIGNIGSGATRANVDTLDLYTAWWAETQTPYCRSSHLPARRACAAQALLLTGRRTNG
ncbi:hypothetical protein [Variovorax sp. PAMC 28711]|uniref:hypothetical protein n=1 Tax=Variovorax sp. PAMC 28711 TaxID=1795631 RepID=UPI00078EF23E|nr:hypothetical protein [Variovorax sp. PAMC 28711]AMM22983.1 hypothetical protein AX767_00260 [Variovorax sp. PAMC 28711]